MRGVVPFSIEELDGFNVNKDGEPEAIWQPLYHYQTYAAAGFTQPMLFFQAQIGQPGVTLEDTNLRTAGHMPTPKNFAAIGIEVFFRPGNVPGPVEGAAVVSRNWNDVNAVHGSRMSLSLRIGDKTYLEEAPLGVMPMQFRVDGAAALAGTFAAGESQVIDYAAFCGPPYLLVPMRFIANQEFSVTINSPAAVPLPSGVDGRIGVRLNGIQYRLAQ
jgi:hypothetical protein